tara:strand:- start:966 stop:1166 length:201 start_codon:yes stop_codon:yes gene_type:complete
MEPTAINTSTNTANTVDLVTSFMGAHASMHVMANIENASIMDIFQIESNAAQRTKAPPVITTIKTQ